MSAVFYLFDVDHGQAAAMCLPNGRWCIFDLGRTVDFSPVQWITAKDQISLIRRFLDGTQGLFLKATVSHLHGDHLADHISLFQHGADFLKTVDVDSSYLADCYATCADDHSKAMVRAFHERRMERFGPALMIPDYGGAQIREVCLPVAVARQVGGDANARVNNASVVTRIDIYGNSILLCGDMQKEALEAIIKDSGAYGGMWRPFLSNVDILVAPHHGHRSGYSTALMNLARPAVVLVSEVSYDPNVDSRYSLDPVRGLTIGNTTYGYISTRQMGHIKIGLQPPQVASGQFKGSTFWTFGDAALR